MGRDAVVLEADPALGLGERCAYGRRAQAMAQGAGDDSTTWHAAVTHQGCEALAQERLQARGIDTVLPMVRYWRVRHRQRFVDQRPLIASVVLFRLEAGRDGLAGYVAAAERTDPVGRAIAARTPDQLPIERVVRGASTRWAVLPTDEVWALRRAILRGDFDATLREGHPGIELPPIVRWLLVHGDLSREAVMTHREARRLGLKFSVAA